MISKKTQFQISTSSNLFCPPIRSRTKTARNPVPFFTMMKNPPWPHFVAISRYKPAPQQRFQIGINTRKKKEQRYITTNLRSDSHNENFYVRTDTNVIKSNNNNNNNKKQQQSNKNAHYHKQQQQRTVKIDNLPRHVQTMSIHRIQQRRSRRQELQS